MSNILKKQKEHLVESALIEVARLQPYLELLQSINFDYSLFLLTLINHLPSPTPRVLIFLKFSDPPTSHSP